MYIEHMHKEHPLGHMYVEAYACLFVRGECDRRPSLSSAVAVVGVAYTIQPTNELTSQPTIPSIRF